MTPDRAPRWLWPLPFPRAAARAAWQAAGVAEGAVSGWRWLPAALAAGTLPLLAGWLAGSGVHQTVSALLLFALFLPLVRDDRTGAGLACLACAFAAHSGLAILLSAHSAEAARAMPEAAAYWARSERWIRTGQGAELVPGAWLPAHLQLLAAVILLGYLSLGLIPFWEGFYELDLMNFYVGRLAAGSASSSGALVLGWHVWSVVRGLGYSLLVYELASLSLSRMTGRPLSTPRRRAWRWGAALALLALDCALKAALLETVQARLRANLLRL